jgi:hypothetical protein
MHKVSALYCRADSIYRELLFDVWDQARDAQRYTGPWPVIAHPPCRAWGALRHFAKPEPGEKALGLHAVVQVRQWGGVLEHPQGSSLWEAAELPRPGAPTDDHGGFTVLVDQGWFGHFAPKPSWLYVVGMPRHHFPPMPVDDLRRRTGRTLDMLPADRERTPWMFARFLIDVAGRCRVQSVARLEGQPLRAPGGRGCSELEPAVTSAGAQSSLLDNMSWEAQHDQSCIQHHQNRACSGAVFLRCCLGRCNEARHCRVW